MAEREGRHGMPVGMDGVEVKVSFDSTQIDDAMRVFGLDVDKGKPRRIWFGEHRHGLGGPSALPLSTRGIIVRIREKKKSDATLKLRGPDGCIDPLAWRERTGNFREFAKIEGDWAGQRRLVSASVAVELDETARNELTKEAPSLPLLLSDEQRQLAYDLMIPLGELELLGPIDALKWEPKNDGDVAAELWEVGHVLRFLEISILVTEDPVGAQRRLEQVANDGGLRLDPELDTKTNTVLRYLCVTTIASAELDLHLNSTVVRASGVGRNPHPDGKPVNCRSLPAGGGFDGSRRQRVRNPGSRAVRRRGCRRSSRRAVRGVGRSGRWVPGWRRRRPSGRGCGGVGRSRWRR